MGHERRHRADTRLGSAQVTPDATFLLGLSRTEGVDSGSDDDRFSSNDSQFHEEMIRNNMSDEISGSSGVTSLAPTGGLQSPLLTEAELLQVMSDNNNASQTGNSCVHHGCLSN